MNQVTWLQRPLLTLVTMPLKLRRGIIKNAVQNSRRKVQTFQFDAIYSTLSISRALDNPTKRFNIWLHNQMVRTRLSFIQVLDPESDEKVPVGNISIREFIKVQYCFAYLSDPRRLYQTYTYSHLQCPLLLHLTRSNRTLSPSPSLPFSFFLPLSV